MKLKVITIKFDPVKETFDDQPLNDFCLKNTIVDYDCSFFNVGNKRYLSVLAQYEVVMGKKKTVNFDKVSQNEMATLSAEEKILFEKMREMRNNKAREGGYPSYILATNNDMVRIIKGRCRSIDALKNLKGFGPTKINGIGKELTEAVKVFFEDEVKDAQ